MDVWHGYIHAALSEPIASNFYHTVRTIFQVELREKWQPNTQEVTITQGQHWSPSRRLLPLRRVLGSPCYQDGFPTTEAKGRGAAEAMSIEKQRTHPWVALGNRLNFPERWPPCLPRGYAGDGVPKRTGRSRRKRDLLDHLDLREPVTHKVTPDRPIYVTVPGAGTTKHPAEPKLRVLTIPNMKGSWVKWWTAANGQPKNANRNFHPARDLLKKFLSTD